MMKNKTELQLIREELGLSKACFSRLVIQKSLPMLKLYEKGHNVPVLVMLKAREFIKFYREQQEKYRQ